MARRMNYMKMVKAGAASQTGSRHMKRAQEAIERAGGSLPALKKQIRRNKQRQK